MLKKHDGRILADMISFFEPYLWNWPTSPDSFKWPLVLMIVPVHPSAPTLQ